MMEGKESGDDESGDDDDARKLVMMKTGRVKEDDSTDI